MNDMVLLLINRGVLPSLIADARGGAEAKSKGGTFAEHTVRRGYFACAYPSNALTHMRRYIARFLSAGK